MKGQFVEVIKRKIPLDQVRGASLRLIEFHKLLRVTVGTSCKPS